jgi:hypothetical protein
VKAKNVLCRLPAKYSKAQAGRGDPGGGVQKGIRPAGETAKTARASFAAHLPGHNAVYSGLRQAHLRSNRADAAAGFVKFPNLLPIDN